MNLTSFEMLDKNDGDFVMSSESEHFCWQCYYYVVVTTKSRFIGEIVFLRMADPIPLTVNHMFK